MKILASVLVISFLGVQASADCLDFSGNYRGKYIEEDSRLNHTLNLKQVSCDKIEVSSEVSWKNSSEIGSYNLVWFVGKNPKINSWYWNGSILEYFAVEVNQEKCNTRHTLSIENSNLVLRFRFECPGKEPSPWYSGSNVKDGTFYRN